MRQPGEPRALLTLSVGAGSALAPSGGFGGSWRLPWGRRRLLRGRRGDRLQFLESLSFVRRNQEELRELHVINDPFHVLVEACQDDAGSRILCYLLAAREESQSRGVNVGDVFKIQDHFPTPGVDEIGHLLAKEWPITSGNELAAESNDGNIVGKLQFNPHEMTSLGQMPRLSLLFG